MSTPKNSEKKDGKPTVDQEHHGNEGQRDEREPEQGAKETVRPNNHGNSGER